MGEEYRGQKVFNNKVALKIFLAIVVLLCAVVISFFIGRYKIEPMRLVQLLTTAPSNWLASSDTSVFYYIRLPRILLAVLVGAALSTAGALFQGVFRNPLVSPDILGVSAGCCLGAALGIVLSRYISIPYLMQILAFMFGILAMILAYSIASISRGEPVVMLILAGMIVGSFANAALSFIKFTADPYEELPAIVFWIMGGLYRANWYMVLNILIILIPSMLLIILLSWKVNILSLGDEEASSLGINTRCFRLVLLGLGTLIVASCVSVSGSIGWVGLVIPHAARIIVGPDHKYSIPMSMLIGGAFVVLMDNIARSLISAEIPISILTAAIGTPFFAYLLIKGRGSAWR
ncbi:MAG: FecCD family ABC transporter permease [Thermacetogeniaceae bacterium]|jgi:iron complex transport system permease protein|nr:iron ABC transporter permease [Thermoanaerobacterales bacterium]NLN21519.1 iron ABC transporter permease [Syntrophomonadaceae bacterium]